MGQKLTVMNYWLLTENYSWLRHELSINEHRRFWMLLVIAGYCLVIFRHCEPFFTKSCHWQRGDHFQPSFTAQPHQCSQRSQRTEGRLERLAASNFNIFNLKITQISGYVHKISQNGWKKPDCAKLFFLKETGSESGFRHHHLRISHALFRVIDLIRQLQFCRGAGLRVTVSCDFST